MDKIRKHKFIIKDLSAEKLLQLGFKRNYNVLDQSEELYTYKFTAYKYKKISVLFCVITIDLKSGNIKYDLYTSQNVPFPPFYQDNFGKYDKLMKKINNNILEENRKLGIVKLKQGGEQNNYN